MTRLSRADTLRLMAETGLQCTGVEARWCPLHGDCTCPREDGEPSLNGAACALHSPESDHPVTREEWCVCGGPPSPEGAACPMCATLAALRSLPGLHQDPIAFATLRALEGGGPLAPVLAQAVRAYSASAAELRKLAEGALLKIPSLTAILLPAIDEAPLAVDAGGEGAGSASGSRYRVVDREGASHWARVTVEREGSQERCVVELGRARVRVPTELPERAAVAIAAGRRGVAVVEVLDAVETTRAELGEALASAQAAEDARVCLGGRTVPPTDREIEALEAEGGLWRCVVTIDGEVSHGLSFDLSRTVSGSALAGFPRRRGSVYVETWWALDGKGCERTWPTVKTGPGPEEVWT